MKFNRTTLTRETLEAAGFVAKTLCRGCGYYSNDPILQTTLCDHVWDTIVTALKENSPYVHIYKKVLLKEVHIYCDLIDENYRGTDIIRYLSRPMSDEEWRIEQERHNISLQQRTFQQVARDVAAERDSVY